MRSFTYFQNTSPKIIGGEITGKEELFSKEKSGRHNSTQMTKINNANKAAYGNQNQTTGWDEEQPCSGIFAKGVKLESNHEGT